MEDITKTSSDNQRLDGYAWLVLPVMALAFYIAFIPHQGYLYPVHIDEWVHMIHSQAILQAGATSYPDPFSGEAITTLTANLEMGFQIYLGVLQRISGISWMTIFRYFPAIVFSLTALSTYVMANRYRFGWEAAFFVCLIPTTVGILGPAFLVPVAMGLLFIPLSLFVAMNFRSVWAYLVLFVFTCFLVAIHAPSAICLMIILAPYILLNLKGDFKHSLFIFLALLLPFLAPFPWIFKMLGPTAQGLLTPQVIPEYIDFPHVIKTYGYLPVAFCLLGTLALALKGGKRNYSLVLGLLAMLAMLVTYFTFHYGIEIMYSRGLMFMMLMIGIVAGAGLMIVRELPLPDWAATAVKISPTLKRYLGWSFCLVIVGVTLFINIPKLQNIPYYQMIGENEYRDFVWIRDNIGEEYEKAILDPWQATPFIAITEKKVYTRLHAVPMEKDEKAAAFLNEGCRDTDFLRENGISIVYTKGECQNPDLVKVQEHTYLLEE